MMQTRFRKKFGHEARWQAFAPGRVNLIGEHIDYCGGSVLPMAIAQGTTIYFADNDENRINVYSDRYDELYSMSPSNLPRESGTWGDYVSGVISLVAATQGSLPSGKNMLVQQNIGSGGLSSSASFCVALAKALMPGIEDMQLARLCQQVEHQYAGVNCGLMDQMSVICGGVILLDCNSFDFDALDPEFNDVGIIVMDTRSPRTLAASAYNQRVVELESIAQLAGLEMNQLAGSGLTTEQLSPLLARRLSHVLSEQGRVVESFNCIKQQRWRRFGELMNESHASLRDNFEVSSQPLDLMVDLATSQDGVYGARMTGGGFGGCAIALAQLDGATDWMARVAAEYRKKTGLPGQLFIARASSGVSVLPASRS